MGEYLRIDDDAAWPAPAGSVIGPLVAEKLRVGGQRVLRAGVAACQRRSARRTDFTGLPFVGRWVVPCGWGSRSASQSFW